MTACEKLDGCPFTIEHSDVQSIAASVGIELRGDEGQPFHCGKRMAVRSLMGPDYAQCECGLTIGNIASPAINGGYVFEGDEVYSAHWDDELGDCSWVVLTPSLIKVAS